jgi:energy-coupling factor transporter ATP-binding protein EcfA2
MEINMSIGSVVGWANKLKKNLWWRYAIKLAAEKGELGDDDFVLLLAVAKMEQGLKDQDESYAGYITPLDLTGFGKEQNAVNLKSIGKVSHVSALVSDALLEFETNGLTAVYGDNGSGKSSYAKILKNACLTRGNTPKILPNIYEEETGDPAAEISIVIGQEQHDVAWSLSTVAREDLKSIRIFDNTSATHYISGEDTIEYKPAGMKLLSQLMRACEFVRTDSDIQMRSYNTATPLPTFSSASKVFTFVSTLSDKTKVEDVDALCLSKEQEDSIQVNHAELVKLKTSTPEQIRKVYDDRCKGLQPLLDHLVKLRSKLDQECLDTIKNAFDDYKTKQTVAELARTQAIEGHELSGICSPEWSKMWNHVKLFVQTHNAELAFPPTEGAPCPTCLQPISDEAAKKLKSFNDYLKDQTQVEAKKAQETFDSFITNLKLLRFDIKPYEFALGMIREHNPEYTEKLIVLNSNLETLCGNLIKAEPDFTLIKVEFNAVDWISGQIDSWKKKEAEVATNEGLVKQIADLTLLIQELEDKKIFTSVKQNILGEIDRLKMLTLYNDLASSCQSTQITTQTSTIAKSGAIGSLQIAFNEELKKLRFRSFNVATQTRGSQGKQLLKLNLTGKKNGIADVASEGEQKCVALASFLAELTVDDKKSAIIFDDPINSLDHKWRRMFAKRIAEEALHRQVIVFTHDMSFLIMLKEATEKAKSGYNAVSISKRGKFAGYPKSELPWELKSTGDRIKQLNGGMDNLRKLEKNGDIDSYEEKAKVTYNLMRETWERLVEEWLFVKVVERFSRSVKTQSLHDIVYKGGIIEADYEAIDEGMSKCSTFMYGHDEAPDLNEGVPNFAELDEDLEKLKLYFESLKSRRTQKIKK